MFAPPRGQVKLPRRAADRRSVNGGHPSSRDRLLGRRTRPARHPHPQLRERKSPVARADRLAHGSLSRPRSQHVRLRRNHALAGYRSPVALRAGADRARGLRGAGRAGAPGRAFLRWHGRAEGGHAARPARGTHGAARAQSDLPAQAGGAHGGLPGGARPARLREVLRRPGRLGSRRGALRRLLDRRRRVGCHAREAPRGLRRGVCRRTSTSGMPPWTSRPASSSSRR